MSQLWVFGALANVVLALSYLGIAFHILRGIIRAGQWRANPLALATGCIFFTCGIGHGLHFVHMALPSFGLEQETGAIARANFADWHIWLWDSVTASVAVWYFTLRGRFPALLRGTALFEDIRVRRREALEIHDNVVQGLAAAKLSLDLGRAQEATAAVERTLAASRKIITDLLGEPGSEVALKPGDLRRKAHLVASR
jgi:signal transduction histidine kinase